MDTGPNTTLASEVGVRIAMENVFKVAKNVYIFFK